MNPVAPMSSGVSMPTRRTQGPRGLANYKQTCGFCLRPIEIGMAVRAKGRAWKHLDCSNVWLQGMRPPGGREWASHPTQSTSREEE